MAEYDLMAESRQVEGKKVGRLRREGLVPAVVYGPAIDGPVSLQLNRKEFETLYARSGASRLITLTIGAQGAPRQVFIRDVQYNMLRRRVDHVDFYAARMDQDTTASVPLLLSGEAPIAARGEGVVSLVLSTITVRGLPQAIPASLPLDVSTIESLDDDIRVADLPVPDGVTVMDPPDAIVLAVTRVQLEVEPTDEEPASDEEPGEAAAEAEGATDTAATGDEA